MTNNSQPNIIIRPAKPEDAEAASPLMYSSGPEGYDYCYQSDKHNSLDFIRWCFVQGKGFSGYQAFRVAELNGLVVGTAAWYTLKEYKLMSKAVAQQTLRYFKFSTPCVVKRSLAIVNWMKPPARDMLYLAYFGVAEDQRGRGIGQLMLEEGPILAKQKGYGLLGLDVAVTNPKAQALYERFGMQVVSETPFKGKPRPGIEVPAARRMVMAVG